MAEVAGQHEPGCWLGGAEPERAAAVDVVTGDALQPEVGDHRQVLHDGAALERHERHRQTGGGDPDPAQPHPARQARVQNPGQGEQRNHAQGELGGGHAEQPAAGLPRPEPHPRHTHNCPSS